MQLFVSHASEDKGFARPLAEALKRKHKVWFDEYELVVGHSLLQQIDKGLRSSDYGVVVLSPAFFEKKWPQAELDGLFALETATRKMILPVWKDLSHDEMLKHSPILADRFAAQASEGVDKVAEDIFRSVEVSSRTREITNPMNSAIKKARLVDDTMKERMNADTLSRTEEGVALVREGFALMFETLKSSIHEFQQESVLKFAMDIGETIGPQFRVRSNFGITLDVVLRGLGGNWTYDSVLSVMFHKTIADPSQRSNHHRPVIQELEFRPTFRLPKQVVWAGDPNSPARTSETMAAHMFELLVQHIETETRKETR